MGGYHLILLDHFPAVGHERGAHIGGLIRYVLQHEPGIELLALVIIVIPCATFREVPGRRRARLVVGDHELCQGRSKSSYRAVLDVPGNRFVPVSYTHLTLPTI